MDILDMQREAHKISRSKGWYERERDIPEFLALIHSEVSKALEDWREDKMKPDYFLDGKPDGFPSKMANIVIRVGDLAEHLGIDLDLMIEAKMAYNRTRPYRHGGKRG